MMNANPLDEYFGGMDPWECFDEVAGKSFALQSQPGPGGVDSPEMAAPMELPGELEVVKDPE
jgi:hypothetical protein